MQNIRLGFVAAGLLWAFCLSACAQAEPPASEPVESPKSETVPTQPVIPQPETIDPETPKDDGIGLEGTDTVPPECTGASCDELEVQDADGGDGNSGGVKNDASNGGDVENNGDNGSQSNQSDDGTNKAKPSTPEAVNTETKPQEPVKIEITNPQDFAKPSDTTVINNPKDETNTIEQWVRTILIPIILWLLAKIVMYNVHRYRLIRALYADVARQVLAQVRWLAKLERWVDEPEAVDVFGTFSFTNTSTDLYQESLADIKKYLWDKEIAAVHRMYDQIHDLQATLIKALSFQKEVKVVSAPVGRYIKDFSVDSGAVAQAKARAGINRAMSDARAVLVGILRRMELKVEETVSVRLLLENLNVYADAESRLRGVARPMFYPLTPWYIFMGVIPCLSLLAFVGIMVFAEKELLETLEVMLVSSAALAAINLFGVKLLVTMKKDPC